MVFVGNPVGNRSVTNDYKIQPEILNLERSLFNNGFFFSLQKKVLIGGT